jgi:hypothetical protein
VSRAVADRREIDGAVPARTLVLRCAWCKRIEVDGAWIAAPGEQASERIEGRSHGICPDCLATLMPLTPRAPL